MMFLPVAALASSSGYEIQRVRRGNDNRAVLDANRKQRLPVDQFLRKSLQQRQIDFGLAEVDEFQSDFFGERLQGIAFGDITQADRGLHHVGILAASAFFQLLLID